MLFVCFDHIGLCSESDLQDTEEMIKMANFL